MDIVAISPDDRELCMRALAVENAAVLQDCPPAMPRGLSDFRGKLRTGWDGRPNDGFLATDQAGTPVGYLGLRFPTFDNLDECWFELYVHPGHRRRGYGSALLEFGLARAKEHGRGLVGTQAWEGPHAAAFAARHGFEARAQEVLRRQTMAELDWPALDRLYDEARTAATGYDLVRVAGPLPPSLVDAYATALDAMNDAPLDDLEHEDEVHTPERVRLFEAAVAARGCALYRVIARRRSDGALAGFSEVEVEHERPEVGWQLMTGVVRAHRGHRLGALVKIEMNRWLREVEPSLATIDTWNAESNSHMIAVNEQIGYRRLAREIVYQRRL